MTARPSKGGKTFQYNGGICLDGGKGWWKRHKNSTLLSKYAQVAPENNCEPSGREGKRQKSKTEKNRKNDKDQNPRSRATEDAAHGEGELGTQGKTVSRR